MSDDPTQVLSVKEFKYLKEHIGQDIITASGNTLLGADDKAGVAEIVDMANFLMIHPEVKHGTIKLFGHPR
ncbi:MAG: hypothetical protein WKG06_13565 [Segetibacter sp.]